MREVDRELEAEPEQSQAQKNKKASGEARRDRHNKNTWHAKKAKRHTVMRGVCAAGLEAGAVVASEVVEARVVTQLEAWVEACSMRALLGSLLLGLMVRGWFTRLRGLPDGQEVFEEIPAEDAFIKLETNFANSLTELFPRRVEQAVALAGARVIAGSYEHRRCLWLPVDGSPGWTKRQRSWVARSVQGKVVTWLEGQVQGQGGVVPTAAMRDEVAWQRRLLGLGQGVVVNDAWPERGVNRGSLLRHVVDICRKLETAHIGWKLDWADWQAAGGQHNTRPYRPPSPFALTPSCNCKAHHIKLDTKALFGLMRTAGMLPADITSLPKFRSGVAGPKDSEVANRWNAFLLNLAAVRPNVGQKFAKVVHTDGEYVATTLATWPAMWAELSKRRWSNARFQLYGGKQRTVAKFWAETVKGVRVRCNSAATGRPLALAYGAAGFSGSGNIGSKGVPVKQMQREACKQFPGRVVLVHEFWTSRVSSARTNVVAGQAESFRWLHPVRSMATRSRIRGLMCSTSNVIKRGFYDRDVSAALNIARIAAGPGRPRELSSWLGRPAMPNPGRPGQEWMQVRDRGLLRKWQRRHQRQR
ncbi:hypothetical protein QJQ45_012215 [Haematococcus lacustris]|nr:hypothetical protein QJQ45_012215 [Haematococcus lacustris]